MTATRGNVPEHPGDLLDQPAMTAGHVQHARDLLARPDNTVSSIGRLLGVSRAIIYKYVPQLVSWHRPPSCPHPRRPQSAGGLRCQVLIQRQAGAAAVGPWD